MFAPIFSVDLSIIVPHVEIAILKQFNLRAQLADTPCVLVQTEKEIREPALWFFDILPEM